MCKDEAWSCRKSAISTGGAESCSQKLLGVTQSNSIFIFSTEELQIQECSDLIIIKKIQHQRGGGEGGGILQNMRFSMAINLCHKNVTSPLVLLIFSSICY